MNGLKATLTFHTYLYECKVNKCYRVTDLTGSLLFKMSVGQKQVQKRYCSLNDLHSQTRVLPKIALAYFYAQLHAYLFLTKPYLLFSI